MTRSFRGLSFARPAVWPVAQLMGGLAIGLWALSPHPVEARLAAAAAQAPAIGASVAGEVLDPGGAHVAQALVTLKTVPNGPVWKKHTDHGGTFVFTDLPAGDYVVSVTKNGFAEFRREISVNPNARYDLSVPLLLQGVSDVITVFGRTTAAWLDEFNGLARMADVQDTALYAGKKSEVLLLDRMDANVALGTTRQVFAKVPGTNIWENDGSGLQIGVSHRGLDPNRSWEINSRQNGYDITADIFGYPEAYFTPPLEAVERIEVVRGGASLQYGAQFGGLVNYVLKRAPRNRTFSFSSEQTGGGLGVFNSHTRVGGTSGPVTYNGYYHHRQGDGWRDNSGFDNDTSFGALEYVPHDRLRIAFEFTGMRSKLQMAGGLTDAMFQEDGRQSVRSRNWFALKWLLPSLRVDYGIAASTRLSVNVYGLSGKRYSLFNAAPVVLPNGELNPDDPTQPRTLYNDRFHNIGGEVRLLHGWGWLGQRQTLAAGVRYYRGKTVRQHGVGQTGSEADFDWLVPDVTRNLHFKNNNIAVFAENAFKLTSRLTVTPGFRVDHIDSNAEGRPIVGTQHRNRLIPLFGVGVTHATGTSTSVYGNVSQAYRATLFNDFWRPDPAIVVDPNLKDMTGYTAEFGWRGQYGRAVSWDLGGFYLKYGNRLGLLTQQMPGQPTLSLWTNVSDSRNIGLESFIDADITRLLIPDHEGPSLSVFNSLARISARYLDGNLRDHRVEFAPELIVRTGATLRDRAWSVTLQHSHVGNQFTDATNTLFTIDGVQGLIPAYRLWDLSGTYQLHRHYQVRASVNNLAHTRHFTRRAASYPGPGLIPADGRTFLLTVGVQY